MDDRPQRDIADVAGGLTHSDRDARREAASQIRATGFARRVSLEKRGTVGEAAETALADHELEALHAAAADDDREVRLHAIEALGDFGDARSVSLLLSLLEDDDADVRLVTLDSLGDIGGGESLRALGQVAGDPGQS